MNYDYIPHSNIVGISIIMLTERESKIIIQTTKFVTFTTSYFTTDSNGISGTFTSYPS